MSSSRSTRLRETIQGILGRVLRIEPQAIDPRAPFVELGADSLALVEALRGLQEAYGVKLTIRQLFEQLPTVEALAAYLDQSLPDTERPVREEPVTCSISPPAPPPAMPKIPIAPGSNLERVFNLQIQAFHELVAQQLQMLGSRKVEAPVPVEAPPSPVHKPVLPTYLGKPSKASGELSERQKRHLDGLIARYTQKTAHSKEIAQRYRQFLADSRATVGFRAQTKEMLYPIARDRGKGARIWDVDGNEYVDVTMGMGVHLFGHDQDWLRETIERQVRAGFELGPRAADSGEVAQLFCELTGMERATFTNSGTEACMTAIRLARAKTGRTKIAMFAGSYHGHSDGTLAQSQEIEGQLRSFPVAPGIPAKVAEEVLVLDYGSDRALEILHQHRHELAAVFVEPIQSRRPDLQPRDFLHRLRAWTKEHDVALLFDEMICGFRLHLGGAQAWFGVQADLATYGKIIGGGLPIGVVAGSAEYMDGIDGGMWRYGDDSRPERETTFFGGTFCQHPLAMAAARTVLERLKSEGPGLQERLNATTARFAARLNRYFEADAVPIRCVSAHSLFRFTSQAQIDLLYYHLVDKGVYVWEWRNCFLSTAHTEEDLDHVVRAVEASVAAMRDGGFLPEPPKPDKLGFWGSHEGKPAISPLVKAAPAPAITADRDLRFGLYFFGHYQAEFQADKYELLFSAARWADAHGLASIWFPERHFHPFGGLSPNPSVLASALARETSRIALRAGSVVLPLHHPARVAEEWALVDNLAGGRVGVAYASGWHPNDFALAPESYGEHRELMFTRIETVRRLWQGEAVRIKDGAGSEVDVKIFPLPSRRDLPTWITIVHNPDTWRRAGALGAGVLTNLMGQTVETIADHIRVYREALRDAGHPPEAGHVTVLLHTFLGPEREAAIETARRPFYRYLESSVGLLKTMIQSEGLPVDFERLSRDDLDYMLGLAYRRYVETSALIGSPDSVAPIVERLRGIGVDEIACLVDFGVEREAVLASLPWLAALQERFPRRRRPAAAEPLELPLTEAQEDLLAVVQLGEAASVAYNEPGTLGLEGPLDLACLRRALQEVVDRHQALRAVLPPPGPFADPVQRVLPDVLLDVPLLDVSALPGALRDEAAAAWSDACGRKPFDLARGPLVRASVLRLGPRSHQLFLAVHHLMADGLSVVVIVEEILAVYEAERAGRHAALPAPMQLADYVAWTRREQDFSSDEAYWLDLFAGGIPVFEPPTDRPRPPVRTFRGAGRTAVLAPVLRAGVRQTARQQGATFFIALLAAYTALLHRWTGQDDLVVGVPTARRPLEGGDRLVAHAVDLVPIRSTLAGNATFAEHLTAVRGRVFAAHDHGDYPFPRLVRALKAPHDLSRAPLANVVFNLDQDLAVTRAGGLQILGRSPGVHGVKLDLVVHALERGDALRLDLEYSTDLFDAATMLRFLAGFERVLEAVVEDPGRPVAELPLVDDAERFQLLAEWGATPATVERSDFVADVLAQAERSPDALAIRGLDGQDDLTYRELVDRARRVAGRLAAAGAGPETRVAICLDRSPELLVAVLGTLLAGAAYVPLDPAYPAERLALMLDDAAAALLVTRRALSGSLPAHRAQPLWIDDLQSWPAEERPAAAPAAALAYVLYTSGSTGRPKGIAMPRRAVANLLAWQRADFPEPRRVLQFASLSFDASFQEIFSTWTTGGALVLIAETDRRDAHALCRRLRDEGVERLFLPFVALQQIAEAVRERPELLPSALVQVIPAGEQLRVTPAIRELFARLPEARLFNHYGPSETHVATSLDLPADASLWPLLPSIGRPIAGGRAVVVDDRLEPVALGVAGELLLGGALVARGYLGRPELTAERFLPDPWSDEPGARLYRTGDRVRWTGGGVLEFLGRADDQVKIRGFRVEPGEIEAALADHPGVRDVAVVLRDEEGDRRLAAFFLAATEPPPASRDLRRFLAARLPEHMVPAVFVPLASFPQTPSGKVDRRALARLGLSSEPREVPGTASGRTLLADLLAGLWAEVLGLPAVEDHVSFFDLGGHSLLATRLVSRVRDTFGVELSLAALFEHPTVATLAQRIDRELMPAGEPIVAQERDGDTAPLSFAQERLWLTERLAPGSRLYNLAVAVRIEGDGLDPAALAAACAEIVRRHEALRTTFETTAEGDPRQRVHPFRGLALPWIDLTGLADARDEAARVELAWGQQPFDLATGPLFVPLLIRISRTDHALIVAAHHIVADGWSFAVFGSELADAYRTGRSGPPLSIQVADFAAWQRRHLAGATLATQLAFWQGRLAEAPTSLALPFDRPRPEEPAGRGAIERLTLPAATAARLAELSRQLRATPFMLALAVLETLLARLTGQDDFLLGTPIANRNRAELEGLIGFFVNTLVLRADLADDPAWSDLVGRVREETLAAYAHQDVPFEKVVEAVAPGRDARRIPLVQVTFAFQNVPQPRLDLGPGFAASLEDLDTRAAKFDLTFFLEESGGRLAGGIEYATELFDAATVRRMTGHFLTLLASALASPHLAPSTLSLLTPEEERELVVDLNRTAREYPREATVHRLFAAVAAGRPDAPAVEWDGGTLSYGELDARSDRVARRLRHLGVRRETPVVLAIERSPELIVAMLGVLKAGGFYVPLDPSDPPDRRAMLTSEAGQHAVVLDHSQVSAVWLEGPATALPEESVAPSLAYAIFTSGSTGRPKGVAVPHRAIIRLLVETDYVRLGPDDRVAHLSNTAFDAATFEVWGALLSGARMVILPREAVLDPAALGRAFQDRGITAAFLTTTLFNETVRANPWAFAGVRYLLVGGEAVSPRFLGQALAHAQPGQRLLNAYGPTESTTFALTHHVTAVRDGVPVPIGRPIANTVAHVVDRHLRLVPQGAPGELLLGGDGLARGYFRRPERTAERFVPDPFAADGSRLYRTGDLVRRRGDGAIEFLGRADAQVKVRGYRVELGEIEAALLACPGVAECAVVAMERDDAPRQLVAWVVRKGGEASGLRAHLRARLPEPMVPAVFVEVESLPRTASGKLDRRALARTEVADESPASPAYQAPRTPLEELVASAWADVLGRPRVGLADHFFDLGGHSLLASRVLTRLRGALAVEVSLSDFFKDPTVQGLVRRLEQARRNRQGVAAPPLVRASRERPIPLSFAQERLWLVDQLQPGGSAYNSYLPLALGGDLSLPTLAAVLREIQRRHEVLRTTFAASPSGPVQVIHPSADLSSWFLPLVDLSRLVDADDELRRLSAEEAKRPFDLQRGPLLRAALVRRAPREHALLLNLHHSVSDGWSLDVMAREVGALYRAFLAGKPSPLPELPIQYADFASWQRGWLQGETLADQLDFWRRQLADQPAELDLPCDRPRPAVPTGRGGARAVYLSADLAARLAALARSEGGTLFTVLLAGYAALLSRLAHQERVSVGTPVANRTAPETEGLIGFFVNTLVLAADLSGDPTGRSLVAKCRETVFAALDHQDLPFEKVVAALVRDRDPGRQPLFQAMFVLQNNQLAPIELPGLQLAPLPTPEVGAQVDLALSAVEAQGGIVLGLGFSRDLFDPATPVRWLDALSRLLESMASDPTRPVVAIDLLSSAERHQATVEHAAWPVDRNGSPVLLGVWGELSGEKVRMRPDGTLERFTSSRPSEDRLADRKRELAARRGQLSADKRALLAKWVSGRAGHEQPTTASPSPLVAVQPEGTRTPFFVVHPGHGAAHPYLELGGQLKPEQPLYAFESPGLTGGPLFSTLEEMAASYLGHLRGIQPTGPYRLGGWCTGGVAAFEMTRQLLAAGEEVEILLLLDSHAPPEQPGPPSDEVELLVALARQLATTAGKAIQLAEDEVRNVPVAERLPWLLHLAGEHGILPPSFSLEQAERAYATLSANVRATETYRPQPLAVPAVLFRAAEQPPEATALPSLGWERWIEGPLEVIPAEGDHGALLREPGVADLAAAILARSEVAV